MRDALFSPLDEILPPGAGTQSQLRIRDVADHGIRTDDKEHVKLRLGDILVLGWWAANPCVMVHYNFDVGIVIVWKMLFYRKISVF